ncbi:MAG: glycosyltransferase family 10 [bacterium]|nr:glycosyltransferase family 10 [bacterium]
MLVKLTGFSDYPILRQTRRQLGLWGGFQFFNDEEEDRPYDFWVVYGNINRPLQALCPPERLVLVTGEPPSVDYYPPGFTKQFCRVITSHRRIKHPDRHLEQQGLPWHVGRRQENHQSLSYSKDYDELCAIEELPKSKLISVISSNKRLSKGHRARLDFVMKLKDHFGDQIDLFGRGLAEIADKWDALAPYRYHVCIENSAADDYWTEKLSDSYLALSYPLYYGCPNLTHYFEADSFRAIDIHRPDQAIQTIQAALDQDLYGQSLGALQEAKTLVLKEYNLFALLARHLGELAERPAGPPQPVWIKPYLWQQKVGRQLIKRLGL